MLSHFVACVLLTQSLNKQFISNLRSICSTFTTTTATVAYAQWAYGNTGITSNLADFQLWLSSTIHILNCRSCYYFNIVICQNLQLHCMIICINISANSRVVCSPTLVVVKPWISQIWANAHEMRKSLRQFLFANCQYISSHFTTIHSWSVLCSCRSQKSIKTLFWEFRVFQSHRCW